MLSKSQIKLISLLQQKKYRTKNQLFFAEGTKVIQEFYVAGWKMQALYSTQDISLVPLDKITFISENELKKISVLKSPNTALAVFEIPTTKAITSFDFGMALDGIRDPGNLGTLIRLCDWFGLQQMFCSMDTVDCFNPKVVQAAMGSLARVKVHYIDLASFFESTSLPIYGAFMAGENVYQKKLLPHGILLLGNEGRGISKSLEPYISKRLRIPQFGLEKNTESLNVAIAASILLSEFHRFIEK